MYVESVGSGFSRTVISEVVQTFRSAQTPQP